MTKLEEAEEMLRLDGRKANPLLEDAHCKAILDELARLRGEAERTVYAISDSAANACFAVDLGYGFSDEATARMDADSDRIEGDAYLVRLSATKVAK